MIIELEDTALADTTPEQLRLEFAIWLYQSGRYTKAQARRLTNLNRLEFEAALAKPGLSTELTVAHLEQDLATLRKVRGNGPWNGRERDWSAGRIAGS